MQWARACAGRLFGWPAAADGEEIIHDLGSALQHAGSSEAITTALIDSVRRLTGAQGVQWVPDEGRPNDSRSLTWSLPPCGGRPIRGRLVIEPAIGPSREWTAMTRRRLETLCTMAGCALSRADSAGGDGPASGASVPGPLLAEGDEVARRVEGEKAGPRVRDVTAPVLQDATFLGAVLPFALGQARRHGEPLSVLCVAIDRLHGICELLGGEVADRTVRNVGAHVAALLRSSDIVTRMDDDRIMVVLPRARIQGALVVAQKICRSIETTPSLLPELPLLTVSIGVAECPSSALDVDALCVAADAALAQAKHQGRNRAVAAPALETPKRLDRPCLAG